MIDDSEWDTPTVTTGGISSIESEMEARECAQCGTETKQIIACSIDGGAELRCFECALEW